MSIKHKLILTIIGISIASVILTVSAITAYLIYDMRQTSIEELEVTAALTADRNSAALLFLDDERAAKNLELFKLKPAVLIACVYNAKGVLFAAYEASGNHCPNPADALPPPQKDRLTATKEILANGALVGSVLITSDTRQIDVYVSKIIFISASITMLVLAVTVILAMYFQRTISAPILELAATARTITQRGDYTLSARETDKGETGVLAHSFNAMLAEVRKRDAALTRANETLEQKVEERTRELELAMQRAKQANAAKSEFLRNMSHEFRTPLHALISFSSYGIREHDTVAPTQLKQYFELIHTCAGRLSKLVNEVLDLAKLEHGEHVFSLKRVNLRELLTKSVETMQPLLEEKALQLSLDIPDAIPETVCDADKIIQVVTNVLGNAIKFTPTGGKIHLTVAQTQLNNAPAVAISVVDEGIGIPEEEKTLIFESFKQSSRTNNGAGGTGLGLAISRKIMEAHDGRIWAENNHDGVGARVTFIIPALLEEGRKVVRLHEMEQ